MINEDVNLFLGSLISCPHSSPSILWHAHSCLHHEQCRSVPFQLKQTLQSIQSLSFRKISTPPFNDLFILFDPSPIFNLFTCANLIVFFLCLNPLKFLIASIVHDPDPSGSIWIHPIFDNRFSDSRVTLCFWRSCCFWVLRVVEALLWTQTWFGSCWEPVGALNWE